MQQLQDPAPPNPKKRSNNESNKDPPKKKQNSEAAAAKDQPPPSKKKPSLQAGPPRLKKTSEPEPDNQPLVRILLTHGDIIREIFTALDKVLPDTFIMYVRPEKNQEGEPLPDAGICVETMDPARIALVSYRYTPQEIAASGGEFYCNEPMDVALSLPMFKKNLHHINYNQAGLLWTVYAKDRDTFVMSTVPFDKEGNDKVPDDVTELRMLQIDEERLQGADFELDVALSLPTAELQRTVKNFHELGSDSLEIEVPATKKCIIFRGNGDLVAKKVTHTLSPPHYLEGQEKPQSVFKSSDGKEYPVDSVPQGASDTFGGIKLAFLTKMLVSFTKIANNICPYVNVYMGNDAPIVIEYRFVNCGILKYMLPLPTVANDKYESRKRKQELSKQNTERRKTARHQRRLQASAKGRTAGQPNLFSAMPSESEPASEDDQQQLEPAQDDLNWGEKEFLESRGQSSRILPFWEKRVELDCGLAEPGVNVGAACWHCCHPFPGVVYHAPSPRGYDEKRQRFHVYGNFCSASCVKYHLKERVSCYSQPSAFRQLLLKAYGWDPKRTVVTALPRQRLRLFDPVNGISIDEFRRFGEGGVADSSVALPHNLCIFDHKIHLEYHRIDKGSMVPSSTQHQTNVQSPTPIPTPAEEETTELKIMRKKPLPGSGSRGIDSYLMRKK